MPNGARTVSTLALAALLTAPALAQFRPPAVPLIAHDPYFSVWSTSDKLGDGVTRHWTGKEQPLSSLIRIDGRTYRLMGKGSQPLLPQTGVKVGATRTIYTFTGAGTSVRLTFTTPSLPDKLDVFARPTTYLTYDVRATDGKSHSTAVYFGASGILTVNVPSQEVVAGRQTVGKLTALRIGSEEQPILAKRGDDLRIDWGHLYVAAPGRGYLGKGETAENAFASGGTLPTADSAAGAQRASEGLTASFSLPFGNVGKETVSKHLTVAYDDLYSIQYFKKNLRPYWRRNGMDAKGLLAVAEKDYASLFARCAAFDNDLALDLTKAGGPDYAVLGSLAYRQSLAAQKLVADPKGQPLMFSKENFSNGCIATVDVLYPAAPQLLLFSPTLTKASLVPVLEYAASSRWKWPFAPHDLGQYPKANGQVYGGGERTEDNQMPVEESGNMLLLLAALAKEEGNAKFSAKYWPQLSKWAAYLADKGFDPESQLSTDDFAGHLAHNVNLSAKAIEALGAYAYLADKLGKTAEATKYKTLAKSFAQRWVKEGKEDDHYRLAFDRPNTWSQKYNLVWDRIIDLNLFPTSVMTEEMAYYRTKQNAYGLPLDNREDYTKLDWITWTATATGKHADFADLVSPIVKFLNETPDRVPMTDWYWTSKPNQRGFQARSVVGGVFIKMLDMPAIWKKYVARDKAVVGGWAPIPKPPIVSEIVPTSITAASEWTYTIDRPSADWFKDSFDTSGWMKGEGGFGSGDARGGKIRTEWTSNDIWLRRDFNLTAGQIPNVQLYMPHDDGAEVYINGVLAFRMPNAAGYENYELPKVVRQALRPGKNTIAIHCHEDGGDQFIDAGFVTIVERN
jgi:hypothetical protein